MTTKSKTKERMDAVERVISALTEQLEAVETQRDELQDTLDNMEEFFSETERYQRLSDAADDLDQIAASIQEAIDQASNIQFA